MGARELSMIALLGKAEYSFAFPGCAMDREVREPCFLPSGFPVAVLSNGSTPASLPLSAWCKD